MPLRPFGICLLTALMAALSLWPTFAARGATPDVERYPYGGPVFTTFVAESYRRQGAGSPHGFYRWMDGRRTPGSGTWGQRIHRIRTDRQSATSSARRSAVEKNAAAELHRAVKKAIPRFSLDRGFEFASTVRFGERQCFLQSVLLAGMLQAAGIDAGVVMVYRNPRGEESNNGHAVTLLKLADGRDMLLDASEQHPFAAHQGIFAWDAGARDYRYVDPVFRGSPPSITGYARAGTGRRIPVSQVRTLPLPFLRSQFEYYRGERAPGGPAAKQPGKVGLTEAAARLRAANRLCPENPLVLYMLGRVCEKQGNANAARRAFTLARRLYGRYGWTPGGMGMKAAVGR